MNHSKCHIYFANSSTNVNPSLSSGHCPSTRWVVGPCTNVGSNGYLLKKGNNSNLWAVICKVTPIIIDWGNCHWAKTNVAHVLFEEGQFQHTFFIPFPTALCKRDLMWCHAGGGLEQSELVTSPQRKTSREHIHNNSFGILVCKTTALPSAPVICLFFE